jgi:hypothetical protein
MNSNTTTQGAAAGSYGGAAMFVVVVAWALKARWNMDIPADVGAAIAGLIGILAHFMVALMTPKDAAVNVPVQTSAQSVIIPTQTIPEPEPVEVSKAAAFPPAAIVATQARP